MSEKTVLKQFFKFDRSVFPPASAPFRRGLAIGVTIGATVAVVLFAGLWVGWYLRAEAIAFIVMLIAGLAGLPWTVLFDPDSLLAFSLPILVNGLILGIIIGVISVIRNRKKVLTIVSPR